MPQKVTTFTWEHPLAKVGTLQHTVTDLHEFNVNGSHVAIVLTDDKGRKLSIQTNQPYSLRTEEQIAPTPANLEPVVATSVR